MPWREAQPASASEDAWFQPSPPTTMRGFLDAASRVSSPARSAAAGAGPGDGARFHGAGFDGVDQHVFGEADHHGTRPAAEGREDGVVHHAGGGGGVVERHDLLGGAAEPGVDVEFLERLPAAVRHRDEAHEQDHRGGVLVRGVDGDEGVGGTGTTGHHGHARKLREPAFGEGHEPGAAFVAGHHGFNGGSVEAVQHIQEALPGDSVDALDAGAFELGNNQVPCGG